MRLAKYKLSELVENPHPYLRVGMNREEQMRAHRDFRDFYLPLVVVSNIFSGVLIAAGYASLKALTDGH